MIIQVDEFPVLCGKLNCDYTYIEQQSLITGFSVSGLDVTISGTGLPLELSSVSIARVACAIDTENMPSTDTEIMCTLAESLPAGSWHPQVKDEFGLIAIDPSVPLLEI